MMLVFNGASIITECVIDIHRYFPSDIADGSVHRYADEAAHVDAERDAYKEVRDFKDGALLSNISNF